jgi:diguanylate cyclase (GGDEF)-like protein
VSRIRYIKGNGGVIDVERRAAIIQAGDSNSSYLIIQVIDTTQQKQLEKDMRFMAFHDPLTGLGNRLQFQEKLASALQQAEQERTGAAIVFLDLDQFKLINDTIGHQAGDQALREIGRRIAGCVRKNDTVARVGGDEFIVLLPTINKRANAEVIVKKMIRAIEEPVYLAGCQFSLQASFGIAIFPDDGQDADSLIAAADLAMYRCKRG